LGFEKKFFSVKDNFLHLFSPSDAVNSAPFKITMMQRQ